MFSANIPLPKATGQALPDEAQHGVAEVQELRDEDNVRLKKIIYICHRNNTPKNYITWKAA